MWLIQMSSLLSGCGPWSEHVVVGVQIFPCWRPGSCFQQSHTPFQAGVREVSGDRALGTEQPTTLGAVESHERLQHWRLRKGAR